MSAPTVRGLLLDRADDDTPGLLAGQDRWSWREVVDASRVRAGWMDALEPRDPDRVHAHVGVLMPNRPEYVWLLGAASLSSAVLVGLNPTRRGAALARDVRHTACDVVLTDPELAPLLDGLDLGGADVVDVTTADWTDRLAPHADAPLPDGPGDPSAPFVLVLTSGTTSAPKAVVCSTGKIGHQGSVVPLLVELTAADTTYVCMPLFHSNAIIAGWAPTLAVGATLAIAPRFSASGFLEDVRRYGATYANYVGTPLSYVLAQPARPDDADLPLRVLFGNEGAPADVVAFGERFGCRVLDAYGSTEGGISVVRTPETPAGALGVPVGDVRVLDPDTGAECARADIGRDGRLRNAAEAVGELVNLDGRGAFEGYWGDPEAEAARVRDGRYHSGDLGYRDPDGFLWFAGRTDDWLRVGGENFAAAPVQRILGRHPGVREAVVLGVPDATAGDQVLAVLVPAGDLDVAALGAWLGAQPDLSPTWWPRFVRVVEELPRTGTGKVARRSLRDTGWAAPDTWVRDGDRYRPRTAHDDTRLDRAFAAAGRAHLRPGGQP